MKTLQLFLVLITLFPLFGNTAGQTGKAVGIQPVVIPEWWNQSFLDIAEDSMEAGEEGKHLIMFFHLDDCPYCSLMAKDHFNTSNYVDFLKDNFNVVDINIRGDREVTYLDGEVLTEKKLSENLNVFFTPVMLFINDKAKVVLRLDGYRDHQQFEAIVRYIAEKQYNSIALKDYLLHKRQQDKKVYQLLSHKSFIETNNLSTLNKDKLTLIVVEDKTCTDCAKFHQQHLQDGGTLKLFKAFNVVRLDALSDDELIDFEGKRTTVKDFLSRYDMIYRPGMMIFEKGSPIALRNSWMILYHFQTMLSYFGSGAYKTVDRRTYGKQRAEETLQSGKNIDYSL